MSEYGIPQRNWRVVALSPANTVVIRLAHGGVTDTGERPSEYGTWGLLPAEVRILRSGLTRTGRDRRPR